MKLRKAIKKIAAIGTGATMVGATLFGAAATDLSDYPSPLMIKNGQFDGIIVVGDAAASSDVIGAVDIATSLQYESKTEQSVSLEGSSASTMVLGDAAKLSKSSDPLNFGESLDDPISSLTSKELDSLADGSISNQQGTFKYNQYIDMPESAAVVYEIDDDQSDDPALYAKFDNGAVVYTYKASFPTALESDIDTDDDGELDDIENKKIVLLGKEYTILKAENSSSGTLTLELMSGSIQDTLEEYSGKTYTLNGVDYEVEVIAIGITGGTETAMLKVNGEVTEKLVESETYKLSDGTEVGIKTILENEGTETGGGDIVEFYLGAHKVKLEEDTWTADTLGTLEVADELLSDVDVNIKGSVSNEEAKISEIEVMWTADEDFFVPVGGKLSERLESDDKGKLFLENLDFEFAGEDKSGVEEIDVMPSGDDEMKVTLTTKTDGEFTFTAFFGDGTVSGDTALGAEAGEELIVDPATALVEDQYFVVSEGKYSHVMQLVDFRDSDSQVWFKNVATGEISKVSTDSDLILDGKTYTFTATFGPDTVTFDSFGSDMDEDNNTAVIYTENEGKVILGIDANDDGFLHLYEEELEDADDYQTAINVTLVVGADTELDVFDVSSVPAAHLAMQSWDSKDDYKTGVSKYGTMVEQDTDEQGSAKLYYPDDQSEYAVYVSSGVTTTSVQEGSDGGSITTTSVNPITVGTAKLASEVSNVAAQNMIVVGGPCANSVAAQLMGNPSPCTQGFEEGKAIIKLYENGNKVAMLVAGATALDTRRAARVLADYSSYSLSGMEVEVKGTSTTFSDTVVSQVTHMEDDMAEE